jgi:hypothetical protein
MLGMLEAEEIHDGLFGLGLDLESGDVSHRCCDQPARIRDFMRGQLARGG